MRNGVYNTTRVWSRRKGWPFPIPNPNPNPHNTNQGLAPEEQRLQGLKKRNVMTSSIRTSHVSINRRCSMLPPREREVHWWWYLGHPAWKAVVTPSVPRAIQKNKIHKTKQTTKCWWSNCGGSHFHFHLPMSLQSPARKSTAPVFDPSMWLYHTCGAQVDGREGCRGGGQKCMDTMML